MNLPLEDVSAAFPTSNSGLLDFASQSQLPQESPTVKSLILKMPASAWSVLTDSSPVETFVLKSQDSVMAITSKMEIVSLVDLALIL